MSIPVTPKQQQKVSTSSHPWGVPGEEHKVVVVPYSSKDGAPVPGVGFNAPGNYKVQILLSRPGYPISGERQHNFIDNLMGDSHIAIAKPLNERKPEDADHVQLDAYGRGKQFRFLGFPNENGFLGKLVLEHVYAQNFNDAESQVYEALAPFLSAWSLHLDIPVHVETIQVTDLTSHANQVRVRTPNFEMTFAGGITPQLQDDFCQYASLYREGLNSNSGFYRFLCFFKIIESLSLRRTRIDQAKRDAGEETRRQHERVPDNKESMLPFLKSVFPWRNTWDDMALEQMFPQESVGKKVGYLVEKFFNPLRVRIAHALLDTGEIGILLDKMENIQEANKWLPLCRIMARAMLRNDFPVEFGLQMQPLALPGSVRADATGTYGA